MWKFRLDSKNHSIAPLLIKGVSKQRQFNYYYYHHRYSRLFFASVKYLNVILPFLLLYMNNIKNSMAVPNTYTPTTSVWNTKNLWIIFKILCFFSMFSKIGFYPFNSLFWLKVFVIQSDMIAKKKKNLNSLSRKRNVNFVLSYYWHSGEMCPCFFASHLFALILIPPSLQVHAFVKVNSRSNFMAFYISSKLKSRYLYTYFIIIFFTLDFIVLFVNRI